MTVLKKYAALTSVKNIYKKEVRETMSICEKPKDIIRKEDLDHLPLPLQNYIESCGWIGKERIHNYKINFDGEMKMGLDKKWIAIKSEQYNFFLPVTRLFHIKSFPIAGIDTYIGGKGNMLIKLFSRIKVVDEKGPEMDVSELVTFFDDTCIFAAGALPFINIKWVEIDKNTVEGTIEDEGMKVTGRLLFNESHELINFITHDRYYSENGNHRRIPWSTPLKDYKVINGIKVTTYGEGVHHLPEKEFVYARFRVKDIEYNKTGLKI